MQVRSPNDRDRAAMRGTRAPRPLARTALVALCAVAVAGSAGFLSACGSDDKADTLTVAVDGPDANAVDDSTIVVPKAAVAQAAALVHEDLRDESPPEAVRAAPEQLDDAAAEQARIAANEEPLPTAGASAGFAGCKTTFVNNQSGRGGVRPQQMWLHYTVSPNRPGWSDVNSIVALFDRSSAQASSHFVIDREGHCAYIVPIERKAWTQAAANPIAIAWEVINSGKESSFMSTPGYAKLRSTMREVSRRTGIPMRRSNEKGCSGRTRGILQHRDGGICAGGHSDVAPFAVAQILKSVAGGGVTKANVVTCRKINAWRRAGRPKGGAWERNTVIRVRNLGKRGVVCTTSGALRK